MTKLRKKLIEVALPLEAINNASAREKSIRFGHPSTLHLWWARRPLAAVRAVIFAQMVDDPSSHPKEFPTEELQEKERQRLFRIIEELVQWENTTNEVVMTEARKEIWKSWLATCADNAHDPRAKELFNSTVLPAFHDPFAGGGALPLEAQRLGLESYGSDLNPVAVLINKAMIEIPPKFAGWPPINPAINKDKRLLEKKWHAAEGLAEDVRFYGEWMRDEARKQIGRYYPEIEVTPEMAKDRPDLQLLVGRKLTVMAWLWARTVNSPNPAFADVEVPLASTFILSNKEGKFAYVEPVLKGNGYRFSVKVGRSQDGESAKNGTKLARGANFRCVMSGTPISQDYIRSEFRGKRARARLMAIVADSDRGRVYLPPTDEMESIALRAVPEWKPDLDMNQDSKDLLSGRGYGFKLWNELFTSRQLLALTTFSNLVGEARSVVERDARAAKLPKDDRKLDQGGTGAVAYADAVAVYLAMAVSKLSDAQSTLCRWKPTMDQSIATFGRQALPMVWDYSEANVFGEMAGDLLVSLKNMMRVVDKLPATPPGHASQLAAQFQTLSQAKVVSTDPPYYDNIAYADLSDYFYIWLHRSLKSVFPSLFATLAVPKDQELVATAYRHGGREKAEVFFLDGMTLAIHRLVEQAHPYFPVTIFYAFKQSETEDETGTVRTGWETFLDAVIRAGFVVSGTWPMRTELANKVIGLNANMLASSIVLVCRPRVADAPTATRREFLAALKAELPEALKHLQKGNIAPVDLAQAAIGPGMAVYTRYASVLDASGKPLAVREALALINQMLDQVLAEQEGDFDADSRWALAWFEQSGFADGEYGVAEILSKAKNTSIAGMLEAGTLASKGGKVRLLRPDELSADWDPVRDPRLTAWEVVHQLIRALESNGESAAAKLVANLGSKAEIARELAYRLFTLCERNKRAQEALSYNGLVQSWPEILRLSREGGAPQRTQAGLFQESEE